MLTLVPSSIFPKGLRSPTLKPLPPVWWKWAVVGPATLHSLSLPTPPTTSRVLPPHPTLLWSPFPSWVRAWPPRPSRFTLHSWGPPPSHGPHLPAEHSPAGLEKQACPQPYLSLPIVCPTGAKGLLEAASPHLGRQPQAGSDSQPFLHGDCSGQATKPAHAAAAQD